MCAVPNMAVFCSSLTSWFPGMLLMYFLNDFEIVPVAPIVTGITFVFTFHMRCISIVRSLYFKLLLLLLLLLLVGLVMMVLALAVATAVRRKGCGGGCSTNSVTGDDEGCWAEVLLDAL